MTGLKVRFEGLYQFLYELDKRAGAETGYEIRHVISCSSVIDKLRWVLLRTVCNHGIIKYSVGCGLMTKYCANGKLNFLATYDICCVLNKIYSTI